MFFKEYAVIPFSKEILPEVLPFSLFQIQGAFAKALHLAVSDRKTLNYHSRDRYHGYEQPRRTEASRSKTHLQCIIRSKLATHFGVMWPLIPGQTGQ